MIENSNEKKKIFYMVVLVLTLIIMIIGATIAYFSLVASQKKEGTVLYTGTLAINYIDGVYLKNPELIPMTSVNYSTYQNVYRNNFTVASAGTLDQTITVELEVSLNEFNENALKYVIYNDKGESMSVGYVPKSGKVTLASNMFLAHDDMTKYTLIIWLNNAGYNQNQEMGSKISGKINVHAKQIKY